mgnify:CR=1 FL=1
MISREMTQEVEYPPTLPPLLDSVQLDEVQDKRLPFTRLEASIVRAVMAEPNVLSETQVGWLRYVVSFARSTWVRTANQRDIHVEPLLSRFRWFVKHQLEPILERRYPVEGLKKVLPLLVQETQRTREMVLEQTELDGVSLQQEVCNRQLVLALGGGGGSGYGYAGAMRTLHHAGIPVEMISGTSIGSLIGMFRVKTRIFDQLPMMEAVRSLTWASVLRVLKVENRYGVPATLRLYLRSSLDEQLRTKEGRSMRFSDCEIPFLVVATGLTVDAFKHDLSFYEHLMDDAFVDSPRLFKQSSLRRIVRMTSTLYEFLSNQNALREVVFGADELTANADVIDAAGFSSAVTGLLHYDVLRDEPRMTQILDQMYGKFGITRLTEGGLVNNVPVKPLLREIMRGRIHSRNPFVLALDCFSPQLTSMWYPVQKMIVPNVRANIQHADQYFALGKRLSPINVVPTVDQSLTAMNWTSEDLQQYMPFITRMCASHVDLPYQQVF